MRCTEPGCTGTYEDGYCNVCGSPQGSSGSPTSAAWGESAPAPGSDPAAEAPAEGSADPAAAQADPDGSPVEAEQHAVVQPGLAGRVAKAAAGRIAQGLRNAAARRQGAAGTSARAAAAQRRRQQRRGTGTRLGMGLTTVPTVPYVDPSTVLMKDPVVPEERRVCPNCGAPVGRSHDEGSGRTEGYCPQCRAPYSFTPKLQEGDVVAGQYEVAGALAYGGLGWIYLARDTNVSGRWVVLKGLLNSGDEDAQAAAVAEQRFLAQVEHPLIVEIYNVVSHEGAAYIVMEYVGGTSLKQMLKARLKAAGHYDPFPVAQALAYVLEILPAFSYLHDAGLLYCDFKPDNLIQVGDSVKLIDLGGVRRADDLESPIYGTVGYQAPEVAETAPTVASDIYTIGRTLAVLTFEFRGYQSTYATSLPPRDQVPAFREHDAFYRLVAKACAPDPDDRFLSIEELRSQMVGVLRQVVHADGDATPATQSAHSLFFEPPTVTGETLPWWELPTLRHDDHDPMLDWLASVGEQEPMARYAALSRAPEASPEVLLEMARAALRGGRSDLVKEAANTLLAQDPWDWRAVWMLGLDAIARGDSAAAISSFGAVRDQIPGELAPRLALGLAAEVGGHAPAAEQEYLTVLHSDSAYVAAGALGLARLRSGAKDPSGAVAALELVPASSRTHPRAQLMRARLLSSRGSLTDLREAVAAVQTFSADPRERASFQADALENALRQVLANGPRTDVAVAGVPATEMSLRNALEKTYRELATLTPDPEERAGLVDRANDVRPWSLI
ncbi:tetratricopeptide repeat protein [Actinomycetota bacterium]